MGRRMGGIAGRGGSLHVKRESEKRERERLFVCMGPGAAAGREDAAPHARAHRTLRKKKKERTSRADPKYHRRMEKSAK